MSRHGDAIEEAQRRLPAPPADVASLFAARRWHWYVDPPRPCSGQEETLERHVCEQQSKFGENSSQAGEARALLKKWYRWNAKCDLVYEDCGEPTLEKLTEALEESTHKAGDAFICAPTQSLADVLLKLELVAEIDDLRQDPTQWVSRIVLGLIADIRCTLGLSAADGMSPD